MEELVEILADLQVALTTEKNAAEDDPAVVAQNGVIKRYEEQLADAVKARDAMLVLYTIPIEDLTRQIEEIKAQIIETWDGDKKTIKYDAGTLKFRTTQSLKIVDNVWLLGELLDHSTLEDVADKYIKGFNLTAVKKYMGVHELPIDVAEIEYKTNVNLDVI